MILRIVKMTVRESARDDFVALLKTITGAIRNVDGCNHLDILQDIRNPNIFFSYSLWESQDHLNRYRRSDFFLAVWSKLLQLFADAPEAWSVDKLDI